MNQEILGTLIAFAVPLAVVVLVFAFARRQAGSVRDVLLPVVTAAGWANLEPTWFTASGFRGLWRTFPVELAYAPRQKGVPRRLILKIRAPSQSRILIKRRMYGFLSRPFTLFGPPVVEMRQPAAQELWVRADEPAFAERIFGDGALVSMISKNLVAAFDQIRIDGSGIRVIRSLDDRPVRAKYNMPVFAMKFEPERFEPIAREMVALSEALAGKVSR